MRNPFKRRDKSQVKSQVGIVLDSESESLCVPGYTSLDHCPEIMTAVRKIAETIGSMTIQIMSNTDDGDVRIVNELSRTIDINPMPNMVRSTWMQAIVMTMLLPGRGNAVVLPHTYGGYIRSLEPISWDRVTFNPIGRTDYEVIIDGRRFRPDDVLHFVHNPDPQYPWKGRGIQMSLKDVANNLKQAEATKKGFLESKWKPSVIVKVDAMTEQFQTPKGREKILNEYVEMEGAGKPWIIPGEQIDVETIKPLTLADLAISDTVEIDKRTVASVIGVPPFVLGLGEYDPEAWNGFIQDRIKTIALSLAQEMTKKIILSQDWYVRFNALSLMDWDIEKISNVYLSASDRGFVDGNEYRDRIGMSPREGLNELRVLENYIPAAMSGQQSKLVGNDNGGNENGE